jgi:hypothetical protein
VAAEPVDLRRSFAGLAAAARSVVRADPVSGHAVLAQEIEEAERAAREAQKESRTEGRNGALRRRGWCACAI